MNGPMSSSHTEAEMNNDDNNISKYLYRTVCMHFIRPPHIGYVIVYSSPVIINKIFKSKFRKSLFFPPNSFFFFSIFLLFYCICKMRPLIEYIVIIEIVCYRSSIEIIIIVICITNEIIIIISSIC